MDNPALWLALLAVAISLGTVFLAQLSKKKPRPTSRTRQSNGTDSAIMAGGVHASSRSKTQDNDGDGDADGGDGGGGD